MASRKAVKGEQFQRAPEITRLQLGTTSWRRARRSRVRHGEQYYLRGELGRLKLLRADVAQTHWWRNLNSPWRMKSLARRVDADQKIYKSPLDHFI